MSAALIARQLAFSRDTVLMTVEDFSEAELLVRPVPAANHPYWQLGHLCDIEVDIVNSIRSGTLAEPAGEFRERFSSGGTKNETALTGFGKEELLAIHLIDAEGLEVAIETGREVARRHSGATACEIRVIFELSGGLATPK